MVQNRPCTTKSRIKINSQKIEGFPHIPRDVTAAGRLSVLRPPALREGAQPGAVRAGQAESGPEDANPALTHADISKRKVRVADRKTPSRHALDERPIQNTC